jgi:type IV pilus assembly protein PilY1
MTTTNRHKALLAFALLAGICVPRDAAWSAAAAGDDTALFSAAVPPNVMLLQDNSGSMNSIVWYPGFDPSQESTFACNHNNGGYTADQAWTNQTSGTKCGTTRTYYIDPRVKAQGQQTRYDMAYLNWLHSLPNGSPILTDIASTTNGTYSACLQAEGFTSTYAKYQRSRTTAARDVLRDVVCQVNQAGNVRFGLAEFRMPGGSNDPNGGFVIVPVHNYTDSYSLNGSANLSHGAQLDKYFASIDGLTWTPLAESLFQVYTYFMSRSSANLPLGKDGSTKFPAYVYNTNVTGNWGDVGSGSNIPPDPLQYSCQKNFVIIITDGEPTMDNFATNVNTGDNTNQGFGNFVSKLIGPFAGDVATAPFGTIPKVQGPDCVDPPSSKCALYLDDVAAFMHQKDFRPDLTGSQTIDVYTVGFTTSPQANDLLGKTAAKGGGLFFHSDTVDGLATAIVNDITDIIQKSQAFTAATVPATRTSSGGNIYTSLFIPNNTAYWEGHLQLFQFTASGDILDSNGNCALLNPTPPGTCQTGQINPSAPAFWDAANQVPAPASRKLYTSMPSGSVSVRTNFDTASLGVSALGDPSSALDDLTLLNKPSYPLSQATSAAMLAQEIIQNARGCQFGTGAAGEPGCATRSPLLGDIFHSNPIVVGTPQGFLTDTSYGAFRTTYATRTKVIYAGANDGFLHGFHAGDWQTSPPATQAGYDRGTGAELFGFMPWPARRNIRYMATESGSRTYYFVDGSPAVADVWFYSTATQTAKASDGSEWRTVLMGGLRQGGNAYYALDVTNPSSPSYPAYLWEFPAEGSPSSLTSYMGQTWGQPIITKIKVRIAGQAYERWVAIVSGGYDKTSDPNDAVNYSASSKAGRAIFVIDLKTGRILGQKEFNAAAPASDPTSQMLYAIASTPAVYDLDGDGFADVIYVGDLGGNVWKWVITDDVAHGNYGTDPINSTGDVLQPNWKFKKFFQATPTPSDPLGVAVSGVTYYKSFFYAPAGTFKSSTLWLSFGSGERANLQRAGNASTDAENNRFYSMTDTDPFERLATPNPTLTEQNLYDTTSIGTCPALTNYRGYFFKAADSEKFVTDIDLFAYYVITSSFTPQASSDPCGSGGTGTLYIFRVYCGEGYFPGSGPATRQLVMGAGMPTDPRVSVSPNGTRVIVTQQNGQIDNPAGPSQTANGLGQLYWREINQ